VRAVLVGGAQMFSFDGEGEPTRDIGSRNVRATRVALERACVDVRAAATGGDTGRTVRVDVGEAKVTVREAGGAEEALFTR
jgi:chemotaxis receptor (MCP) glutamine deamidase CheD